MRQQRRSVGVARRLSLAAIGALMVAPGCVSQADAQDAAPSIRNSTCGFRINFAPGSETLSASARLILQQAVQASAERGGIFAVTVDTLPLGLRRADAVARYVKAIAPSRAASIEARSSSHPFGDQAIVFICSPTELESARDRPADPNIIVSLDLGRVRLRIPLPDASPLMRVNTPLTPETAGEISLYLSRTEYRAGVPPRRPCGPVGPCFGIVSVQLQSRPARPGFSIMSAGAEQSRRVPVPDQPESLALFLLPPSRRIGFDTASVGANSVGICPDVTDTTTARSILQSIEGANTVCTIYEVDMPFGLTADIRFLGALLPRWRELVGDVRRYVTEHAEER